MQDAARTSEAWASLADSLVMDARSVDALPRCDSTDASATKPRDRKRVRRMQVELPFFRHQVHELEFKLKRLKLQRVSPVAGSVKTELHSPRSVQILVQKGSAADQNSVWNGIAERQLKERLRAEQQQQQLKQTHVELLGLSVELQTLLRKCDEHQHEVVERVGAGVQSHRYWDCKKDLPEDIFADQLSTVARMRLQMQMQSPSRALYPGSGLSLGPEMVRWDPSIKAGFKLELQGGTVLPFGLEVAADAYWRFFGHAWETRVARDESDLSTDTIARSFNVQADFEGFTSKVAGKYTARRYVDEDGTVVVAWASVGDIQEFDDISFHGFQIHKKGYFKFRRVPRQGPGSHSTSTVVEASLETIPVFHESVTSADKAQQTRTFLSALDKSFVKVDKVFCQRMGALLVELDCRASFGREAMLEAR
ncbi:uncharacterized protein IUM83_06173 [Phytophthora cinnamomi]|uniref:uncharacterized protein n=1 Tax=Phytophthora cinnamomi TaxID=4785 RepID=UPI00355971BE|nr:hypothetical protein IUM83_06173 [Phytophthora cinnamomi]